jgi:hypothetical protein
MRIRRPLAAAAAAIVVAAGTVAAVVVTGRQTGASALCGEQARSVAGGRYVVQNNEYNSTAAACITVSGGTGFRVRNSSVSAATGGSPGGYPSIYQGCHWGRCSSGGLAARPVRVPDLDPGTVTTTWSTSQPGTGSYYAAYDIWFNKSPSTTGQPDCTELMIWLNHHGPVQPFGTQIAAGVSVGGRSYDIWAGQRPGWDTISYEIPAGTTSVTGLDIGALAQDAVRRGYLSSSCYLISVEAGFGLWHGGAGLATQAFSVDIKAPQ